MYKTDTINYKTGFLFYRTLVKFLELKIVLLGLSQTLDGYH